MTTLIIYESTSGSKRRCDARCHDAKGEKCVCICEGANHGKGLKQAMEDTRKLAVDVAECVINPAVYQITLL